MKINISNENKIKIENKRNTMQGKMYMKIHLIL